MRSTHPTRIGLALALATAVVALALPAVASAGRAGVAPDWFERYAAAHPYGAGLGPGIDGRSADTLDAANDAQQASLIPSDGRSPDTLEAAAAPRPVVFTQPGGFRWGDAGIGAGFAGGLLLLVAAVGTLWLRHQSRQRFQTT